MNDLLDKPIGAFMRVEQGVQTNSKTNLQT